MIEKSCAPSTDLRDFLFEKMSEMFPSPVTSHMLDVMRLLISRMFRGSRSAFPPELNDSRGFGLQKNTGIEGITKEGYAVAGLHSKSGIEGITKRKIRGAWTAFKSRYRRYRHSKDSDRIM